MKLYDAFHGIGGFRYGLEQSGMECVGGCEIDKYACKAYGVINNERCEPTDIRYVDPRGLPDFDVFVFGWPCQDNSVAGKRVGQKQGTRSGLLFEAARILRSKRPKYFIAENVEGLFSVNNGKDFYPTIQLFTDMGYDCQWQVLNTRWFLPQNRERIFFIGHLRGLSRPEIFPIEGKDGGIIEKPISVVGRLDCYNEQNSRVYGIDGVAPTLGTMQGGGQIPKVLVNINHGKLKIREDFTCIDANYAKGLDNHGARTGVMQPRAVLTPDRVEKRQNGRRFKNPGEPMFTLTAQDRHGVAIYQKPRGNNKGGLHKISPTITSSRWEQNNFLVDRYDIRHLTPLECFRLQGYPDEWYYKLKEVKISNSQMYKMAGNGVSSPVAYEIGKRLMQL